jgi:signal transduction histidine kinase
VVLGGANAKSKVLIIDDDVEALQAMQGFLCHNGIDAATASNGKEGVALARQWSPDLILCDLSMPEMDGYEVLTVLRQDENLADMPLIFLTGQDAPQQVRQGMILGADDYLLKIVDPEDLLKTVQARIARSQLERQRRNKQMEQATRMFADVIHELRNPLFVVFGYTDQLKKRSSDDEGYDDQSTQPIIDRMQHAIVRMQDIFSEALFLAKSKMRRLPFDPSPFDLRRLCEQLVADQEARQRLRFECKDDIFPIVADALHLRRALDNLISNALKYSDGIVALSLSHEPEGYRIEVKDSGVGIPLEEQGCVFEPFFRASNTAGIPGHGLGLSIVKSCLEQQGGTIRFQSTPNRGTEFFLQLPPSPKKLTDTAVQDYPREVSAGKTLPATAVGALLGPPEAGLATDSAPKSGSNSRLAKTSRPYGLIVDDDPLVRELLRDWVETSGEIAILGEAGTVSQARAMVLKRQPDVVFLDVNLPDATGFELLPDLKPNASIIFVTAAEEYAVDAFDCEAVDFLVKPFTQERFQRALLRLRQRVDSPCADAASPGLAGSFLLKTLTETRYIKTSEIRSIIAYGEYSRVFWREGVGTLFRKSLKHWVSELPENRFVRVHRNAIVNLAFLDRVEKLSGGRMQLYLRNTAEPIAVSSRLMPRFNRMLKAFGSPPKIIRKTNRPAKAALIA